MSTFDFNGREVYYTTDGDASKPALLILNGIMMSHKSWEPFKDSFTPYFHLVRFDMLDQGYSAKMEEDYTQDIQVDLVKALLDHLNIDRAYIAGISYGGSVALQMAVKYPSRIVRMALFNAGARTSEWLRDVGRGWNEVAKGRNGKAYYHVTIPYIYSPQFYTRENAWMEARREKLLPVFDNADFQDAMVRLTKSAESHDVSDRLEEIEVPTIVAAADHDVLTPPHEQRELAERMPNARLTVFDDCGHASMYEKPSLFVATILGFFLDDQESYEIE